jgi:organic radical activating enzyme
MGNESTEITLEITNYCPHNCKFCSSDTTQSYGEAKFLHYETIWNIIIHKFFDIIHLSGGEPLAHPQFYRILQLCKNHAKDVIVHTNALTHICFNAHVIDNIYVEANLTLSPDVNKLHVLKRVEQGREKTRPEVHVSSNWTQDCNCNQLVFKPDGTTVPSPCRKDLLNI